MTLAWRRYALLTALWSIPAVLMVLQMQASAFMNRQPLHGWRDMLPSLAEWLVWAPATPVVLALARRFPVWPRPARSAIVVHSIAIVVAAVVRGVSYASALAVIGRVPAGAFGPLLLRISLGWLPIAAIVYATIVVAAVALHFARTTAASNVRASELEAALAQAESATLRAQLDPHFLFNSLHSVAALVRTHDVSGAVQMLSDLGELLRDSLTRRGSEQSTLSEEVRFTQRYVAVEQVRFRDRLRVTWQVEREALVAEVPRLILQPLVENAIRHGIAKRAASGTIVIHARRDADALLIAVEDDGPGIPDDHTPLDGIGLGATRTRLQRLFGKDASMALRGRLAGGAIAEVRLPFRVVAAAEHGA